MKSVNPSVYDKNFYLTKCLGSEEFLKSNGRKLHPNVLNLIKKIKINKNMRVLDIGCGRGDITLYLAKKAKECIGIDYSKDAIEIAKKTSLKFPKGLKNKTQFMAMNAKKLKFPNSYFDVIICIDVLEHLYKEEVEVMMKEIKRVLKKDGFLFLRTVTNKILYDFTYKFYIRNVNRILTFFDKKIRKVEYNPFPKDPRIEEEKIQHVNEPTYSYLKKLFKKYGFKGKIEIEVGYIKKVKSFKTYIYNFLTTLYPISNIFPLNLLFGWAFICYLRKK